jgi:hypothetical protein
MDTFYGRRLYTDVCGLGLIDVEAEGRVRVGRGATPDAEFWRTIGEVVRFGGCRGHGQARFTHPPGACQCHQTRRVQDPRHFGELALTSDQATDVRRQPRWRGLTIDLGSPPLGHAQQFISGSRLLGQGVSSTSSRNVRSSRTV